MIENISAVASWSSSWICAIDSRRLSFYKPKRGSDVAGWFFVVLTTGSPVMVSTKLTSARYLFATSNRAILGHSRNQSMVVQLTKAGYCRKRFLKASPTGLMQKTICMFFRTRSIKYV